MAPQSLLFHTHDGVLDQVGLPHIEDWLAVSPAAASVLHRRLDFLLPEQYHKNWVLSTMIHIIIIQ